MKASLSVLISKASKMVGLNYLNCICGDSNRKCLELFFALPVLDQDMVGDAFAFCLMSNQPESDGCTVFAEYIFNTYISETAAFQPSTWTNHDGEGRTTNAREAFHKHFKDTFTSSRPNIFLFLKNLSEEQLKSSSKMKMTPR